MDGLLYPYYLLMSISFGISIFCVKGSNKNIFLFLLLLASVAVEAVVRLFEYQNQNHFILYHFFTPVEYTLINLYFFYSIRLRIIRKIILLSIVLFWIFSIYTFTNTSLLNFPSIANSIESFVLIVSSTLALLTLEPGKEKSIYSVPEFWISLAVLFYFTGTFFFNGAYNYLKSHNLKVARDNFTIINSVFNYLFYVLISYGLICYYKYRKYS